MTSESSSVADDLAPINPSWWAKAAPKSEPLHSGLISDETDPPTGWDNPELLSRELRALADSAPEGCKQRKVLSAMADASHAMAEPEDFAEPFRPFAVWSEGSRTILPSDIDPERIALLAAAAPLIEHVPLRARIADVAWTYGEKSNMALLSLVLDSYLAMPLERWAWRATSRDGWQRAIDIMRRRGKAERARRDNAGAQLLDRTLNGSPGDGFMLIDLADLYRKTGVGSPNDYRALADHLMAVAAAATAPRFARHLERAAQRFLIGVNDDEAAHDAAVRIADLYLLDAVSRLAAETPSAMAAGMEIEKAIETLKSLPRTYRAAHQIDERIAQLRTRLDGTREATLESMEPIATDPVDLNDAAAAAERAVAGRAQLEALAILASIHPLADHEQAVEEARDAMSGGIARLFARATFTADGRKVASSAGSVGDPGQDELWSHIVRYFDLRVGLVVTGRIIPAIDVITIEHRYDMAFMRRLCLDSPTVPPGHVDLWARGLWHGLNGDFPSAISVLLPQAEHLLRHHLKASGVNTLFVEPSTGVESEKGLNTLLRLDAARAFLGPNLQHELRALLVEQEGANLRNETAHGLLTDGAAWGPSAVYAWWLMLRIVAVPLWVVLNAEDVSE